MGVCVNTSSIHATLNGLTRDVRTVGGNRANLRCDRHFHVCANSTAIRPVRRCAHFRSFVVRRLSSLIGRSKVSFSYGSMLLVVSSAGNGIRLLTGGKVRALRQSLLNGSTRMVTRCFNYTGAPIIVSGTYVSKLSTFIMTRRRLLSQGCERIIIMNYSMLSRFVARNFTSFGSVDTRPYQPCSTRESKLALNRTYNTMVLAASVEFTARPCVHLNNNTIAGSTGRVSKPSQANSKLCCTVSTTVGRTKMARRSINFMGARNATAHCGSRVRDGTIT